MKEFVDESLFHHYDNSLLSSFDSLLQYYMGYLQWLRKT
ncbi:hypothetical protein yberc0001_27180 [Yersinia bercovieri ATCC 43970]|uniref:Uncharacterized protein n=1 Tax=Yersinia bercovieri ATCC 43970 TaxID=349968 RepID=A0ABP2E2W1_YERBE|nr:hypothetical protein yberc0001_27180 [Yersinia bercovieri ATCC 43970]